MCLYVELSPQIRGLWKTGAVKWLCSNQCRRPAGSHVFKALGYHYSGFPQRKVVVGYYMVLLCQWLCHLCGELWYHTRAEGFTYVSFTHTHKDSKHASPALERWNLLGDGSLGCF
jgi:hypothetical protein